MKMPRKSTHVILFGASPEVGAACVAGNVEHSDALQAGEGDVLAIALADRNTSRVRESHLNSYR